MISHMSSPRAMSLVKVLHVGAGPRFAPASKKQAGLNRWARDSRVARAVHLVRLSNPLK